MLRQEHAVSAVSPSGAGAPNIIGTEPRWQSALAPSVNYIVHELAHDDEPSGYRQH
jgi:hypothetical protein